MNDKIKEQEPENAGRRKFLKFTTAAATLPLIPANNGFASIFGKKSNAYEALANFKFNDQKGAPVNGQKIKEIVGDSNNFTVSFGFNGCTSFCPYGSSLLGSLAKGFGDNIKHIVINVNPETDGRTQYSRDAYTKTLTHNPNGDKSGVKPENIIVLYSANNALAAEASKKLGYITIDNDHTNHNGFITLYNAKGDYQTHTPINNENHTNVINQFKAALEKAKVTR